MSENATFDVMTSDVDNGASGQGSPFFPSQSPASSPGVAAAPPPQKVATPLKTRIATVAGLNATHLSGASKAEVQKVLESLLGALKNVSAAELQMGEKHGDGSLRITSHLAVWLIGKVTDAYGSKLVRLSKVPDKEGLRSISGLADLLSAAISKKQGVVIP